MKADRMPKMYFVKFKCSLIITICFLVLGLTTAARVGAATTTSMYPQSVSSSSWSYTRTSLVAALASNDSNYAYEDIGNGSESGYLYAGDFRFSVPAGATINGITVEIRKYAERSVLQDNTVQLVKVGTTRVGSNRGLTNSDWNEDEETVTYGGPTDLWGTSWTSSDVNAPSFSVALKVDNTSSRSDRKAYVDYIRVKVSYTAAIVDSVPPAVSTFTSSSTSPSRATSITYALTFNERVDGVEGEDFINAGTATGCTFTPASSSVAGSTPLTVTVTDCSDTGTLIPVLTADSVADAAGNSGPASVYTATTTLTLDREVPWVSYFNTTATSPNNSTTITYNLTFSENVTGISSGDFSNSGTATGCSFSPSASTATGGTPITLTITNCSATGTLRPRLAGNGVTDAAGNTGPAEAADAYTTLTRGNPSDVSIASEPLFLASYPKPNIILLLDTSGSMTTNNFGAVTRFKAAQNAASLLVDKLTGKPVRLGLVTFNGESGGALKSAPADMDLSDSYPANLKRIVNGLSASGYTPLAEALVGIGNYLSTGCTGACLLTLKRGTASEYQAERSAVFSLGLLNAGSTAPITSDCQLNFVIALTDGRPNKDRNISVPLRNYIGDCPSKCDATPTVESREGDIPGGPLTTTTYKNGTQIGRSYEDYGSDYIDDVTAALYDIDLRPSDSRWINNISTYIVGFGSDLTVDDPLMVSAAGYGRGTYKHAGSESELAQSLLDDAVSIAAVTATASSLATNSTRLIGDVLLYQAKFNSADWSGQLLAYPINSDGSVDYSSPRWNTDAGGKIPSSADRKIFTHNGLTGVPFLFDSLSATMKGLLMASGESSDSKARQRLSWLRGDQTYEVGNANGYLRKRTKILGDIVNSDPLVVGAQNYNYDKLPPGTPGQAAYAEFAAGQKNRQQMLYIGGNDGMMHAFNALTGEEKFAYVPSAVFANLANLTSPDYIHKYFVDGNFFAGDAYINGGWKTVLVGTLGAGGKSVFALDITNPVSQDGTVSFTQANVLWEFTDTDLGYTFGQPTVVFLPTGQWAAVFGNGYGSTGGAAYLYVVDLATGALIKKIKAGDTTESVANGLSSPALILNPSQEVQYAYAGDLRGNLWKFDLTHASNNSQWKVDFSGEPFFRTLRGASGAIQQPITAPLEIGRHANGGYMIYFGTGKYFMNNDSVTTSTQSFYGLRDNGSRITATDRSTLVAQTILAEGALAGISGEQRVVSENEVNWASKLGWYLDLTPGERVVTVPLLRLGRVIFSTLIPESSPCVAGGRGWIMELDAQAGMNLGYSVFDINQDRTIDASDYVSIGGKQYAVSGKKSTVGIIKTPVVISAGKTEFKYSGGSEGTIEVIREKGTDSEQLGRRSWRILH